MNEGILRTLKMPTPLASSVFGFLLNDGYRQVV